MGASTKYESEEKNRSFNVNTSLTLHNETQKKTAEKSFSNLLGPVVDGIFAIARSDGEQKQGPIGVDRAPAIFPGP